MKFVFAIVLSDSSMQAMTKTNLDSFVIFHSRKKLRPR
ncbi:unnamed protein product [Acidithrix sp. C25]|nr:unnamed protein product [Acidithrix sp. C25]